MNKEVFFPPSLLLVDDEVNILKALERTFRPEGYRIFTAMSGAEGLAILKREKMDLVISDMRMPEMDGATFLREVAWSWPKMGRILMTGYTDLDTTIEAINEGKIFRYINKPWQDYDLICVVKEWLRHQKIERSESQFDQLIQDQNLQLHELNKELEKKVEERTQDLSEAMTVFKKNNGLMQEHYSSALKDYAEMVVSLQHEKEKNVILSRALKQYEIKRDV